MNKLILLFLLFSFPVFAQSTATQTLPGTQGNSIGSFVPYSSTNLLPISITDLGNHSGYCLTSNGSGSAATFQSCGTGGGGTPGGSSGQFQYNNAGSFAGTPLLTVGTNSVSLPATTSNVVLNTNESSVGASYSLPFANPSSVLVGSTVSGTNVNSGAIVQYVSGGTATVTTTAALASNNNFSQTYIAVNSTAGIVNGMFATDSTTPGNLLASALVGAIASSGTSPYTLVNPSAANNSATIAVTSGGNNCQEGSMIYDTTNTSAITLGTLVNFSNGTSIQINANTNAIIPTSDTVKCYPTVIVASTTGGGGSVVAGDTLVFSPAVLFTQGTSAAVASGTTITFTPPASTLASNSLKSGSAVYASNQGYYIDGQLFATATGGSTYSDGGTIPGQPLSDTLVGVGAGASLGPTDGLSTFIGYLAGNALALANSESTIVGYKAGQNIINGSKNNLWGIHAMSDDCQYGCNSDFIMGTDAAKQASNLNNDICIGNDCMLSFQGSNSIAIGVSGLSGGGAGFTGNNNTVVGYSSFNGGASTTTANANDVFGAFTFTGNITTAANNSIFGQGSAQSMTSDSQNVGIGNLVLKNQTGQTQNAAGGYQSMQLETGGSDDTAWGYASCRNLTTGDWDICLGAQAGNSVITTGSYDTIIGPNSDVINAGDSDELIIEDGRGTGSKIPWVVGTTGNTTNPRLWAQGSLTVGSSGITNEGIGTINAATIYQNNTALGALATLSTAPIANGGTNATTATGALSNLLANPASGTYNISCTSGASCTYITASGGGTVTSSGSPVSGNLAQFTTSTNIAPATSTQIIALFTGCSGSQYLGADGACHAASGSGTVTSVTFTGDGTVLSSTPSSAVTTSGTLTAALANAAANSVLGNNTGSSAAPSYQTSVSILGETITSTSSSALAIGTAGATNPVFVVNSGVGDTNGVSITGATSTTGPTIAAISSSAGGTALNLNINGGTPTGGTGGAVVIAGAQGVTSGSVGGLVSLTSGNSAAGNAASGVITIKTGTGNGNGSSGAITVQTGVPGVNGNGGALNFTTGAGGTTVGNSGSEIHTIGAVTSGTAGTYQFNGGAGMSIGTNTVIGGTELTVAGHIGYYQAAPPVVTSCGSGSLTLGSVDHKGSISGITAATACTITFNSSLTIAPSCIFSDSAGTAVGISAISTSAVTTSMTALTGTLYYQCE